MSQIEQEWGAVRVDREKCARAEANVRAWAAREGWDPLEVLVAMGLVAPPPKPATTPVRVPREVINAKPPALCRGGCGRMVGFTEAARQAGALYHAGRGMCRGCISRAKRDANPGPRRYRPPALCAGGCGKTIAFCKADVTDDARPHHGHGRCSTCAKRVQVASVGGAMRLIHAWRIEDDTRTWSDLKREAQHDLIRRAHQQGWHLLPGGRFEVITSCGPLPERVFLIAHVDVEVAA